MPPADPAPILHILDVGHGNAAVLQAGDRVVVFDASKGVIPARFLKQLPSVTRVDAIIVSHCDQDHTGGIRHISDDYEVERIYVNSDHRGGAAHEKLGVRLAQLERRKRTQVVDIKYYHPTTFLHLDIPDTRIEVLAPSPAAEFTLAGNSASAVVRVWYKDQPVILFPGDLDSAGFDSMRSTHGETFECKTPVLVFPHHGGPQPEGYAQALCELVHPRIVVFSMARDNRESQNPRPEVVEVVKRTLPGVRILCTQLSKNCCLMSDGATRCACRKQHNPFGHAAVHIDFGRPLDEVCPGHNEFVSKNVPGALCRIAVA